MNLDGTSLRIPNLIRSSTRLTKRTENLPARSKSSNDVLNKTSLTISGKRCETFKKGRRLSTKKRRSPVSKSGQKRKNNQKSSKRQKTRRSSTRRRPRSRNKKRSSKLRRISSMPRRRSSMGRSRLGKRRSMKPRVKWRKRGRRLIRRLISIR